MKTKIAKLAAAALIAAAAPLAAQEEGAGPYKTYISAGFSLAHGHAHDMTQKTWGGLGAFAGEFGIEYALPKSKAMMRPNFGYARIMAGSADADLTETGPPTLDRPGIYDLAAYYFGFDLTYRPFKGQPGLMLATGPSFHVWDVRRVDQPPGFNNGDPEQGEKGIKFGWRGSVGYRINGQFSVELSYTIAEWRKIRDAQMGTDEAKPGWNDYVPGFNPSRPCYFAIKGSYIF